MALFAAAVLTGCEGLGLRGFDLAGGIHEILKNGINVTIYSAPMEDVLPVRPVMPFEKIGPPPQP